MIRVCVAFAELPQAEDCATWWLRQRRPERKGLRQPGYKIVLLEQNAGGKLHHA
jgi:hypothetical protein